MTYGDRLLTAMTKAGVDRKALAEKLGVSVQAVGQVITGQTKAFDATNHTKAFMFLECDPLWLATGAYPAKAHRLQTVAEATKPGWTWPFKRLDFALVSALNKEDVLRLEGAWSLAARQLGFALDKEASA